MKVLDVNKSSREVKSTFQYGEKSTAVSEGRSFHRQFSQTSETAYKGYFTELQNKILAQGEILKEKPDLSEMKKYRELVSELLSETVSGAYTCASKNSFDAKGRPRIFVVIRRVNEKMDELTQEIISGQADNIRMLEMVDDIRGLLVDLFL